MRITLTLIALLIGGAVYSQFTSTFNDQSVQSDSSGNYSFIISGHFHGDGNNKSHYPVNTLLANLDWVNSNGDMLVCLGDLFKDVSNDIPNYTSSFFNKLEVPLLNAVGNHDLSGTTYQDKYGATYYSFKLNNDIHIVLDTELDNGDLKGEQLALLKAALTDSKSSKVNNVFIYTHRTIWKDAYTELDGLFTDNTQALTASNYKDEVLPILKQISAHSEVYFFSGSLGPAPASFFHFKDDVNGVTIVATAIRGLPRDAVLKVNVAQGKANFETVSWTGNAVEELTYYDVALWKDANVGEPFNWKLVPYYIELMVFHRYFWYGVFYTLFGGFVIRFIYRKLRKRREVNS